MEYLWSFFLSRVFLSSVATAIVHHFSVCKCHKGELIIHSQESTKPSVPGFIIQCISDETCQNKQKWSNYDRTGIALEVIIPYSASVEQVKVYRCDISSSK